MKVEVSLSHPQTPYGFSSIVLNYGDEPRTSVAMNIDYRNLYEFTKVQSGTAFDLFVISCISLIIAGAAGNLIDCAFYGLIFNESFGEVAQMFPDGGGYALSL